MILIIFLFVIGSVKIACFSSGWGNEVGVGGGRFGVIVGVRV